MSNSNPNIEIKKAELADLKYALKHGIGDFLKAPLFGLFFGGVFAGILMRKLTGPSATSARKPSSSITKSTFLETLSMISQENGLP